MVVWLQSNAVQPRALNAVFLIHNELRDTNILHSNVDPAEVPPEGNSFVLLVNRNMLFAVGIPKRKVLK